MFTTWNNFGKRVTEDGKFAFLPISCLWVTIIMVDHAKIITGTTHLLFEIKFIRETRNIVALIITLILCTTTFCVRTNFVERSGTNVLFAFDSVLLRKKLNGIYKYIFRTTSIFCKLCIDFLCFKSCSV